jgi:hypothetical protein
MVLASAAMLEALGYCVPDEPSVWPPDQALIGPRSELTVTGSDGGELWVRANGERFEVEIVWTGDDQQVLRPTRALPLGPAELVGFSTPVRWTVAEVPADPPRWLADPSIAEAVWSDLICPSGPFVTLSAPLAGARRQPLVELTALLPGGKRWRGRFALDDGVAELHDGCSFSVPAERGATIPLPVHQGRSSRRARSSSQVRAVASGSKNSGASARSSGEWTSPRSTMVSRVPAASG